MNAAESGVSCLKAGRLLCRRQTGGGTSNNNMHFKITFSLLWCTKKKDFLLIFAGGYVNENVNRINTFLP